MLVGTPELRRVRGKWRVRVTQEGGAALEFEYAHESQARYFAAVFAMQPTFLPASARVPSPVRSRRPASSKRPTAAATQPPPSRAAAES